MLELIWDRAVSIHAPVKGRPGSQVSSSAARGFNPRPREGATGVAQQCIARVDVSIHAPVKGRRSATM